MIDDKGFEGYQTTTTTGSGQWCQRLASGVIVCSGCMLYRGKEVYE